MTKYYFVGKDNRSYGPVSPEEFAKWGLTPESLVCPVGGQAWVPLHSVPGLSEWLRPDRMEGRQTYQHPSVPPQVAGDVCSPPPSDYMAWAILATIFCCLPLGVVAIVKSSKVKKLWYAGYTDEAIRASRSAKNWCIWSMVGFFVAVILNLILNYVAFKTAVWAVDDF